MRGIAVLITWLALGIAACAGPSSPSATSTIPAPDVPTPAESASAVPKASASPDPAPAFCPGRTWPPYAVGEVPGITAVSVDRATIEITNHTGQTVYFRVSGWKPDQFETCRALGEVEVVRGPLGPGDTERVMVDAGWQGAGVSVTVAFWDGPCGEACAREPIRSMVVPLSPVEPAAT